MTSPVFAAPRREDGFFPWALLIAVALWALLLLAGSVHLAPHPLSSIALAPVDARLVELPPPPVPPAPAKSAPKPPRPEVRVKKSKDALPVARHRPVAKPKPKPRPRPAPKPIPKPTAKAAPQAQAAVNRDVMGAHAVYSPLPKIPDDLRGAAMDETAVVRLHIHADGTVAVELVRPTDNPRVNRIILDTLRTWMFYPALSKGKPVESVQQIRIRLSVGD